MDSRDAAQVKQLAKRSQKETLENRFLAEWVRAFPTLPPPVRQHKIKNPATNRDWRLDFAWPPEKLAVEVQGGSYLAKGGHNTAAGQAKDYARHNYLARHGWLILYFSTPMLRDIASAVEFTAEVLCHVED